MFLIPYNFYVSYQERKSHRGWPQGEEKGGNKVPFQNTGFGAVINAAHARSPAKIKQL